MSACIGNKVMDSEGLSGFQSHQSDIKFQDPAKWIDDEEDKHGLKEKIQRDQEQAAATADKPGLSKQESYTAKFKWTAANESLELRKTVNMVTRVIEDETESTGTTDVKE